MNTDFTDGKKWNNLKIKSVNINVDDVLNGDPTEEQGKLAEKRR